MRRAVDPLVGDFCDPAAQLGIEIGEIRRFAALQATQKIPPYVLHPRFHFAFRLCPVRPAQPRGEAPVAREVEEDCVRSR